MTFDLRTALEPVWRGEAYYGRRPMDEHAKAGAAFLRGECFNIDPDGRTRNMRSAEEAARWSNERRDVLAWLPQNISVYDLGCGDGKLKVARPDLDVMGWDPDDEARSVAFDRGTVVFAGDDPRGCAFDALWCCHVIEHMADPLTDLAVGIAAVRSGGLVIVETPDFGSAVALEWGERFRLLHDPTHVSLFTSESLIRMLRALNVEVLEVAWPGWFGTPLQERRGELFRQYPGTLGEERHRHDASPPAPGNVVAVRGRKR